MLSAMQGTCYILFACDIGLSPGSLVTLITVTALSRQRTLMLISVRHSHINSSRRQGFGNQG
jgi:hypothetical protein